ncbi:MAG: anthranilate synthase component I [Pseudobdellovibrionaceae bacterium]
MPAVLKSEFADFATRFAAQKNQVVYEWISADLDTPVSAFLKLTQDEPYAFLLESVEGGANLGRYTIIGFAPDLIWSAEGDDTPLASLRHILDLSRINDLDDGLPPMAGSGLFGYMGYDMVRHIEQIPDKNPDTLGISDSIFFRPSLLVIFDNITHKICLLAPVYAHRGSTQEPAPIFFDAACAKIDSLKQKLAAPLVYSPRASKISLPLDVTSNFTRAGYHQAVEKAKEYIRAGDIFQVVPSQRFEAEFDCPPFELYRTLRRLNPSPFLFFFKFPDFALVGSSPEILVRVRDGLVTVRPIAGTRPRGGTLDEDKALEADLLADPKELAEHLMLIDLGRNDVGRVCAIGSVKVTEKFVIERYSHVMHIVSNVEGKLAAGNDSLDAFMSGFPVGTVSGAPKIRAMEIIDELENVKRKFYAGGVGYLGGNGNIDTCIALRTCLVKDGKLYMQAGGGVVADSDPESEYQECLNKRKAILTAAEETIARLSATTT